MKKLNLVLLSLLLLSACSLPTSKHQEVTVNLGTEDLKDLTIQVEAGEEGADNEENITSSIIDFDNLDVEQKIGGMTLKNIGKPNSNDRPISDTNIQLKFEGEIALEGELEFFEQDAMGALSNAICMKNLTDESLKLLPHRASDQGKEFALFCFENPNDITAAIGEGGQDNLTFVIDRYTFIGFEGEAVNMAHFVRLD